MNRKTAREMQYCQAAGTPYLAFELGSQEWRLAFTIDWSQKPRERTMAAGAVWQLRSEIERAK